MLSRDQAGALVGYTLGGLHWMGVIAAVVFLIASVVLGEVPGRVGAACGDWRDPDVAADVGVAAHRDPAHGCVARADGSVDATPASNPRRVEFDRLHGVSVDLEVAVLLIGLASLFLVVG